MLSRRSSFFGGVLAVSSLAYLQVSSIPWWVWVILVIVLIILVYLIISGSSKETPPLPPQVSEAIEPGPVVVTPDDLTKIEGIGPKINQFLQENGINTFAQLAAYDMDVLDKMLAESNLRLADPATWAEQAKLAAAEDWTALETLQENLKGGKRG